MRKIKFDELMKNMFSDKGKHHRIKSLGIIIALSIALISLARFSSVSAAGDAYFTLSPSSGSYTVGNTFVVSISENSTAGDNVNATQANLSYPTSTLQYQSTSLSGPFTLVGQNTGGSGAVNIGVASTTTVSGTQSIAQVTFKVISDGTAPVTMVSGSDIVDNGGKSVFNGVFPSSSYTLTQPSTPPQNPPPQNPPPSSGGSGSKGSTSTGSSSSSSSSSKSTTTTPSTPAATPTPTPTVAAPSLTSISVTITDAHSKPIDNAKVTLDRTQTKQTDSSGVVNFSGVPSGNHTISVTDPGKKPTTTTLSDSPGENKIISLKLASSTSSLGSVSVAIIAAVLIVIILLGGGYWYFVRPQSSDFGSGAAAGTVVSGSANLKTGFKLGNTMPVKEITPEKAETSQTDTKKTKSETVVHPTVIGNSNKK